MTDPTNDPMFLIRRAIVLANLRKGLTPYEKQKANSPQEKSDQDKITQSITQASDELDAFLKSEEGQLIHQLLFATGKRISITSYQTDRTEYIFLNGTGLYTSTSFGPEPTSLKRHTPYLLKTYSARSDLGASIIAKIKEESAKIVKELIDGK